MTIMHVNNTNITSLFPFPWCDEDSKRCNWNGTKLAILEIPFDADGTFVCVATCSKTGRITTEEIQMTVERMYFTKPIK